jgi:hypothetical protein
MIFRPLLMRQFKTEPTETIALFLGYITTCVNWLDEEVWLLQYLDKNFLVYIQQQSAVSIQITVAHKSYEVEKLALEFKK